jgi:hypothetical protein
VGTARLAAAEGRIGRLRRMRVSSATNGELFCVTRPIANMHNYVDISQVITRVLVVSICTKTYPQMWLCALARKVVAWLRRFCA